MPRKSNKKEVLGSVPAPRRISDGGIPHQILGKTVSHSAITNILVPQM